LSIPVRVYGRTANNRPFRFITETNAVSVHGGLLALDAKVKQGQAVLLVNAITEEERECHVVYVESKLWGKRKIGLEFTSSSGDFWHVYPPLIRSK
jgi:predicted CDP-diglyceride synthetase/phosphatidate cytidylyltransferase